MQIGCQKKARVALLLSDKTDFKNKDCNRRQRRTLHNDKEINPTRGYNNCKYLGTQIGASKYIKANINR